MKVLVSGVHGFLGSSFIGLLKKKGIPYRRYDHRHPERTRMDFTHAVHFGGLTPHSPHLTHLPTLSEYHRANVKGTEQFLHAIAKNKNLKKLVNIGTAAELRPRSAYGKSKVRQTHLVERFARTRGVHTVNLRVFNVAAVPRATRRVAGGSIFESLLRQFSVPGVNVITVANEKSTRDFVDLDDIADAVFRALRAKPKKVYEIMNICSGRAVSIKKVVELFSRFFGTRVAIKNTSRKSDHAVGNPRKAQRLLGWRAHIPLEQSIRKMVP